MENKHEISTDKEAEIKKYESLTEASLSIGSTTYTGTVEPSI